jgi:hypothetical protein
MLKMCSTIHCCIFGFGDMSFYIRFFKSFVSFVGGWVRGSIGGKGIEVWAQLLTEDIEVNPSTPIV